MAGADIDILVGMLELGSIGDPVRERKEASSRRKKST